MMTHLPSLSLVDINEKMVSAWRDTFENNPEVTVLSGSMLDQAVDAWVSPTNSAGMMDGGLDGVIKGRLGPVIEQQVQAAIRSQYNGQLPIGHATCVTTGVATPKYLISTPTMHHSSEDVSDTMNVALACAAALMAVQLQNAALPGSIQTVAIPGLGANTGKVPVEICADLMWTSYNLLQHRVFDSFGAMRQALEAELGELGPTAGVVSATPLGGADPSGTTSGPASNPPASNPGASSPSSPANTNTALKKQVETDFDDFDDDDDGSHDDASDSASGPADAGDDFDDFDDFG